jgi:hypothetical protein
MRKQKVLSAVVSGSMKHCAQSKQWAESAEQAAGRQQLESPKQGEGKQVSFKVCPHSLSVDLELTQDHSAIGAMTWARNALFHQMAHAYNARPKSWGAV